MTETTTPGVTTTLRIEHLTRYEYPEPARASYNEARLRPLSETRPGMRQRLLEHEMRVLPPAFTSQFTDYFGTHAVAFEVQRPHESLEIEATSVVELTELPAPPVTSVSWETMRDRTTVERFCEELETSDVTSPPEDLARRARQVASAGDPAAVARAVMDLVAGHLTYRPGSTGVHSTAAQAWLDGQGVCQDYAQLSVGALRSVGIPARYVSGYLMPACPVNASVQGQSHAWVEFWVGRWHSFDPTNATAAGPDHVVVGRGREYRDVRPVHGVVSADCRAQLSVGVRFTRLA